ncbi:MAG: Holliday junction resolvase RuvX [Candidatus Cloacimonetes bacterium]|nr:Holliday junction resolvase RuvX [Candidatus Cloacimonadota bacterium]
MALSRIMGIDYGSVRIGIALSDPMQIISRPYKVILNKGKEVFFEIKEIIESQNVGKVVLGLPYKLDGGDSEKTIEVREFEKHLKEVISIPIILWDETYTTSDANEILKEMGYNTRESRKVVDKIAASIILKDFLDRRK